MKQPWYASNAEAYRDVEEGKLGDVRRVVVHDGHEGPKEIGVSPTFLGWLTDPEKNGAGAMFDFGCYGADLMTLIMHDQTPVSVTAVALQDKPDIYPKVEDDATIIIRYPQGAGRSSTVMGVDFCPQRYGSLRHQGVRHHRGCRSFASCVCRARPWRRKLRRRLSLTVSKTPLITSPAFSMERFIPRPVTATCRPSR